MHAAFSYDRRDPYSRLPIDTPPHQSVDPIAANNVSSEHNVSGFFALIFLLNFSLEKTHGLSLIPMEKNMVVILEIDHNCYRFSIK